MLSFTLIDHTSWYEVVFDVAVLIVGIALGVAFGLYLLMHHIAAGYTYLRRVSVSRTITDDDLWIAFAWGGRPYRRDAMREYERRMKPRSRRGPGPSPGPRLWSVTDDRAKDDPEAGRAG